jgi:hypothetical protein
MDGMVASRGIPVSKGWEFCLRSHSQQLSVGRLWMQGTQSQICYSLYIPLIL